MTDNKELVDLENLNMPRVNLSTTNKATGNNLNCLQDQHLQQKALLNSQA